MRILKDKRPIQSSNNTTKNPWIQQETPFPKRILNYSKANCNSQQSSSTDLVQLSKTDLARELANVAYDMFSKKVRSESTRKKI